MRDLAKSISDWLLVAVAATLIFGTIYIVAQQTWRMMANEPQVQISEDIAAALAAGQNPSNLNQNSPIDLAKSLSTFVIIYDDKGGVVAASGKLNGAAPALPKGVLDYARQYGQNRLTWQPAPGVRLASVVTAYKSSSPGFVLVGRSLRETENWVENWLGSSILMAWLGTLILTFVLSLLSFKLQSWKASKRR